MFFAFSKIRTLTEHFSGPENVIASGRDALAVDAGVEGVCPTRGPVRHGRAQQVVGRRLLDPTKQLALVRTTD
jgi:hypothetical protein